MGRRLHLAMWLVRGSWRVRGHVTTKTTINTLRRQPQAAQNAWARVHVFPKMQRGRVTRQGESKHGQRWHRPSVPKAGTYMYYVHIIWTSVAYEGPYQRACSRAAASAAACHGPVAIDLHAMLLLRLASPVHSTVSQYSPVLLWTSHGIRVS